MGLALPDASRNHYAYGFPVAGVGMRGLVVSCSCVLVPTNEIPVMVLPGMGVRSVIGSGGDGIGGEDLEELGMLLREQRRQEAIDRDRELNLFRSGSAPPTVEGSLSAVGGLFGLEVGAGVPNMSEPKNGDSFLSEEELRSNPNYLSYYYTHVNLNPRLPPPVLSKEDWRSTHRLQAGRSVLEGIGDRRKSNRWGEQVEMSLFSQLPLFNSQEHAMESRQAPGSGNWQDNGGDELIGLSLSRQKSFTDVLQDDFGSRTPISNHPSRPQSRNAYANSLEALSSADSQFSINNEVLALGRQQTGEYVQSINGLPHGFATVGGSSLGKSTTPHPQLVARAPSPCSSRFGLSVGADGCKDKVNLSATVESDDLIAALSHFSLSTDGAVTATNVSQSELQSELDDHQKFFSDSLANQETHSIMKNSDQHSFIVSSPPHSLKSSYTDSAAGCNTEARNSSLRVNDPSEPHRSTMSSANSYVKTPLPLVASPGGSSGYYQNLESVDTAFSGSGLSAYAVNPSFPSILQNQIGTGAMNPLLGFTASASAIASLAMDTGAFGGGIFAPPSLTGPMDLQNISQIGNQSAVAAVRAQLNDPLYVQHMRAAEYTAQVAARYGDSSMERGYTGNSCAGLPGIQKAHIESLLQSQKQYGIPLLGKSGSPNQGYYANPAFGLGLAYPGSPLAGQIDSPVGPGSPLRLGERSVQFPGPGSPLRLGECSMQFPYRLRNLNGGIMGAWHFDPTRNMDEHFPSSLLEEFKNNKTRCFELAEIAGHVVEFRYARSQMLLSSLYAFFAFSFDNS
ncbi:hypothetical protein BHE74_00005409 [Ensete ventricosum]|nr:hypothetical protein GW17_00036269 [Ensete ventricosum]RWW85879.1 hypothetical protein BHE74_00005409 [Ensete ventricosum]RZR81264.1 hypothetical protein BHM03_00007457 [Ensete ventricosum]